jgi:uncharacterized damage-inducible protein DinB
MTMLAEIQSYVTLLRERRAEVLQMLEGLGADALNWRPLAEETNSLYALAVHLSGGERRWIHEVVGQRKIERDREAEFRARGDDVPALRALYEGVAQASEEILAPLGESDLDTIRPEPQPHPVRWCILRILEHYNEHLGQMRLTRQLWENRHARLHEI